MAKLSFSPYLPNSPLSPTFMGFVGNCGKIVIFAIFLPIRRSRQLLWAPFTALCFASLPIVAKLSFSPYLPNSPLSPTFIGPLHCFVFSSLAIVAKLSFSPYFPNLPLSPTFMGPLYCCVLCLVGDWGKIVIFAILAKFAAFVNFYGSPSLLCVFPRWRLWQNCHFRHTCQIRQHFLIFAICAFLDISQNVTEW